MRYILDTATTWLKKEPRDGVTANVLSAWSIAVIFFSYAVAGGVGALSAIIAVISHLLQFLKARRNLLAPSDEI
jgi:hypothetical protein